MSLPDSSSGQQAVAIDPNNVFCFLDLAVGDKSMGRIIIELFRDTPLATENFRALCTGEKGAPLHYAGVPLHRIIPHFMIQGGDVTSRDGRGLASIYGEPYVADPAGLARRHDQAGLLSLANRGDPNRNGSQFFITLAACPHLDGKHCIFGRVIGADGLATLRRLVAGVTTDEKDRPLERVFIARSGELAFKKSHASGADDAQAGDMSSRDERRRKRRRRSSRSSADDEDDSSSRRRRRRRRSDGDRSRRRRRRRDDSRSRSRSRSHSDSRSRSRSRSHSPSVSRSPVDRRPRAPLPPIDRHRSPSPSRSATGASSRPGSVSPAPRDRSQSPARSLSPASRFSMPGERLSRRDRFEERQRQASLSYERGRGHSGSIGSRHSTSRGDQETPRTRINTSSDTRPTHDDGGRGDNVSYRREYDSEHRARLQQARAEGRYPRSLQRAVGRLGSDRLTTSSSGAPTGRIYKGRGTMRFVTPPKYR
ncbi:hypothetical protein H696_00094 [Fonticula alba]|uniref:peptidylprolyl isomerase n=1 Tax=Fonticula alba TaxID=691883 RepID=A0A058ZDR5_FONAL|nr:hypothetical protein H696_00094 [Fonticula alba]KCV72499.1 hypothetical protein H696_00094 [Fonticula alba]|eukprot:XP_009492200.1 hypothetical protein H696_00094 [Fonticula alba]